MKTYRLGIDEAEENYQVFAIYTDEQAYRFAFLLNQHLKLHLVKSPAILNKKNKTAFEVFEYEDTSLFINWFLLSNYCFIKDETKRLEKSDLFNEEATVFRQKKYYFNKYKKASFLLKVIADEELNFFKNIKLNLKQIPQIFTAELIPLESIKNKKIFLF